MGKKNWRKNSKKKTSRVIENSNKTTPIASEKPIEFIEELNFKNNFIYFYIFFAFLTIMLFITYFIPSLETFSYLVSFYSTEKVIWFFIASFFFVIIYLLFANIVFADKFVGKVDLYTKIWQTFHAFGFAFVIVYINSIGYTKIINEPIFWIMFLIMDIVIEVFPFYIGYKTFFKKSC